MTDKLAQTLIKSGTLFLAIIAIAWWSSLQYTEAQEITVYKSPTCGCCTLWIDHLRDHGFRVNTVNITDLREINKRHGITPEIASCHTALVDGYVVEGHVPADAIKRLLKEHPSIKGIAVPGMPIGSPGMEGPNAQPYNILTFDAEGNTTVYSSR